MDWIRDIPAWFTVLKVGLIKIPLKLAAPLAYFLIADKRNHSVFGVRDAVDGGWYNIAIRNGAHNFYNKKMQPFQSFGNYNAKRDWTLEQVEGLQWRYRRSMDRKYVSFRVTWGEPRPQKGKREFYIGWTMDSSREYMRCTFFQLRIF